MNIDDPERPNIAGRPQWREAPIVLPSLILTPNGPGVWQVQFMFPMRHQKNSFSWIARNLETPDELLEFLSDWYAAPEEAVRKYFHEEPPKGKVWEFAPRPEVAGEIVTTKSAEELDL